MPIAFLLAMLLAQAAPAETSSTPETAAAPAASPEDIAAASSASNLPKDDYGLVAWCHGAVAGQLELDPIAHADMISIEGKAKVAARAKGDAEMEKDRREYLHEYERALAAAEKASPTAIHQYGVESEVSGYKLWGATRQKQPIWRMLDWGMWDANDAGCGDAAKRLYNKASLFGEALKGSSDEKAAEAKVEGGAQLPPAYNDNVAAPGAAGEAKAVAADAPAPAATADAAPTALVIETEPAPAVVATKTKATHPKIGATKPKKTKVLAAPVPTVTPEAPTAPPVDAAPAEASPAPAPVQPGDNPLRGPQT